MADSPVMVEKSESGRTSSLAACLGRILIVDDNQAIHGDFRKILAPDSDGMEKFDSHRSALFDSATRKKARLSFELESAYQGAEAVSLVQKAAAENRPFTVAFVDVRMPPGIDGVETIRQIWDADPRVQVVVCTAFSDYDQPEMAGVLENWDRFLILKKPYDQIEVQQLALALNQKWFLAAKAQLKMEDLKEMVYDYTSELRIKNEQLRRDMLERQRAEEREAHLGVLFENSLTETYVIDRDSRHLLEANRGARLNTGYAQSELHALDLQDLIPEYDQTAFAQLTLPLNKGPREKVRFETNVRRKDGSMFPAEVLLHTSKYDGKNVYVASLMDLTQRRQAEAQHAALEAELREAQKLEAIGQLTGGIAHDFNNMLQVINGYMDLLMPGFLENDPVRVRLKHVRKAGQRAAHLTNQLLAFGRRQILHPAPLNLNESLQAAVGRYTRLEGSRYEIQFEWQTNLPPVLVDKNLLEQALINLLDNALDAMPQGGTIKIKTSSWVAGKECMSERQGLNGRYARIDVIDSGTGIPAEHLEHVFEPFFTTKDVGKGSGLGLSMVQGTLKQHKGDVRIESQEGRGTSISLFLPLSKETSETERSDVGALRNGREERHKADHGETVLLAEDEELVRSTMRQALEDSGYRVLEACDGEDAIKLFNAHTDDIDIVVLDVLMPKKNGGMVRAEILKIKPDVPVIFISGYHSEMISDHVTLQDGLNLLKKPFSIELFLKTIRRGLNLKP